MGNNEIIQSDLKKKLGKNFKLSVGIDILIKKIEFEEGINCILEIWKVNGENIFEIITELYYREENMALIAFDLTEVKIYRKMSECLFKITKFNLYDIPYIIIGNKYTELKKDDVVIYSNETKNFAREIGCDYLEISTKTQGEIDRAFSKLVKKIVKSKIIA
ncbi:MAG: hypothetical protein ACXABO_20615 [Promethearchaeota archaeon]